MYLARSDVSVCSGLVTPGVLSLLLKVMIPFTWGVVGEKQVEDGFNPSGGFASWGLIVWISSSVWLVIGTLQTIWQPGFRKVYDGKWVTALGIINLGCKDVSDALGWFLQLSSDDLVSQTKLGEGHKKPLKEHGYYWILQIWLSTKLICGGPEIIIAILQTKSSVWPGMYWLRFVLYANCITNWLHLIIIVLKVMFFCVTWLKDHIVFGLLWPHFSFFTKWLQLWLLSVTTNW